jgi:hypothetical protein
VFVNSDDNFSVCLPIPEAACLKIRQTISIKSKLSKIYYDFRKRGKMQDWSNNLHVMSDLSDSIKPSLQF